MPLQRRRSPNPDLDHGHEPPLTERGRRGMVTMLYLNDAIEMAEDAVTEEQGRLLLAVIRTCAELGFLSLAEECVSKIHDDYYKTLAFIAIAKSLMLRAQDASVYTKRLEHSFLKIRAPIQQRDAAALHDHQLLVDLLCEMARLSSTKPTKPDDPAASNLFLS